MGPTLSPEQARANPGRDLLRCQPVGPAAGELAFSELESSVAMALETYSNVHRGAGHNSLTSTRLYEQARGVVLDDLGLDAKEFTVVFGTPERAAALAARIGPGRSTCLSSRDLGLPLGLRALVLRSDSLPDGPPLQTGGGTTKIVSRRAVVWEDAPDRFEAGTPAVINAIAFARALEISRRLGRDVFKTHAPSSTTPFEILHRDELMGSSGRQLLERLRQTVMGAGRLVPTAGGALPFIQLDNAASTPALLPIWQAVCRTWRLPEDQASVLIALVRAMSADFFGAPVDRYDIVFTSNTTEAINLAATVLCREGALEQASGIEPVLLNTLLEHSSNELPWRFAKGASLVRTPVDDEGFPDLAEMERLLREYNIDRAHGKKRIRAVAVSGASNVLGTCPDLAEISRIAHRHQALVFVDAAQLAGHRAVHMEAAGLDGLAFSGHKMYAPFGSGGLILRKGLIPAESGEWEAIRRSGEENTVGVAALGKAIDLLQRVGMDVIREEERALTRTALRRLSAVPGLRVYGIASPDSPRLRQRGGVISFGLKHVPHNLVAENLAEVGGIGVRNGCFCAHILVKRLLHIHPFREAAADLGLKVAPRMIRPLLPGLVRVSFGIENDEGDIRRLVATLQRIASRRPSPVARLLARTHNATPFVPGTAALGWMRQETERAACLVFRTAVAGEMRTRVRPSALAGRVLPTGMTFLGQPCCRKR